MRCSENRWNVFSRSHVKSYQFELKATVENLKQFSRLLRWRGTRYPCTPIPTCLCILPFFASTYLKQLTLSLLLCSGKWLSEITFDKVGVDTNSDRSLRIPKLFVFFWRACNSSVNWKAWSKNRTKFILSNHMIVSITWKKWMITRIVHLFRKVQSGYRASIRSVESNPPTCSLHFQMLSGCGNDS